MTTDRRSFLRLSALAGGALALGPGALSGTTHGGGRPSDRPSYRGLPDVPAASRSLRLLVLGGTGFTGPHQIRYAAARGHRITVFNRGRSQADLPEGVEELQGDRNLGEVDALRGREWDVIIDNPTTLPFWVRDAGEVLRDATGQYVFISTISVYDLAGATRVDEDTPLLRYGNGDPLQVGPEDYSGAIYGQMKAASEAEALRWYGDRTTIIRPGLIVGPRDQTDRFTYWPLRVARGGDVLAPGTGRDPVQIIDARDLAQWTIRMVENGTTGTFNATGPRSRLTMAEQLAGIRAALPGDLEVRFHWVPADFLAEHEVRPWAEMTTWFGPDQVISETRIDRAVEAGLTFRPLAETVQDTLTWWDTLPAERRGDLRAGLDPEKEARVLAAWRAAGAGR
jgi:2'-hydroxyisoflavone reductase